MRRRAHLLAVLALCASTAAACGGRNGGVAGKTTTTPAVGATGNQSEAAGKLGFPAFATKNTTRVGGADPVADAAGVARAVFPGPSVKTRPGAVALVDARDWRIGVAAAGRAGAPGRAPLRLSDGRELPVASRDALGALAPACSKAQASAQVIRVGDV